MNNAKILTISVAAYNVEKTLDKTLESCNDPRIRSDIEVLVVDDGSKDNTKEVAKNTRRLLPIHLNMFKKKMVDMDQQLIRELN